MQPKKAAPHYRMTEERAHWEYEQGFSTVTGYIYHLVKATRRDGHKFKIDNVAQFCKERGISRAGFYKAIGKLREGGHVAAETHGSVEIWVDDSAVCESEQLSTKVDTLTVYENRHVSTNVDCESTKVDTVSTNVDKKSTIVDTRSSKAAPDIASSAPSTIIQLSNNSFSDQEREEGEKKASQIELASKSESDRNLESTTAIAVQGKAPLQSADELGSGSGYSAAFSSPTKNIAGERINQHYSKGMPEWRDATGEIDPGFVEFVAKGYKKDGAILPRNTWAKQLIKKDASRAADLWEDYQQQLDSRRQSEQAIAAASYPSPAEPYNPPKRQIETRFTDEELRRKLIDMGLRVKESREVAAL